FRRVLFRSPSSAARESRPPVRSVRGTRVCGDEAEVRICEAALSRTEEECHPTVRGGRAGESVLGAEKTVALGTGLARERRLLITGEPPKQAEDRKKPNPSACTGLAEHLLPRRHELIQSFPNIAEQKETFAFVGNVGRSSLAALSSPCVESPSVIVYEQSSIGQHLIPVWRFIWKLRFIFNDESIHICREYFGGSAPLIDCLQMK